MTEPTNPGASGVRASDAERQAVVERLNAAFSTGRLTLEEFNDRITKAYAARTQADLAPLVADLPASNQTHAASDGDRPSTSQAAGPGRTQWHVTPIGGLKRRGSWRMPREIVAITLIGGADLDFRDTKLEAPEVTLTKISLIGGVDLKVPSNMRVDVQGFSLLGGTDVDLDEPADPNAPTLVVRAFSLLGGIKARNG